MHQPSIAGGYARRLVGANMKSAFEPLEGKPKLASLTRSRAHNRVPQAIVSSFTSESLQEIQPGIVAIRPEQTCNELAKSRDLDILCPYPMPHGHEDDHAFKGICAEQTLLLISGESYRRRMAACRP